MKGIKHYLNTYKKTGFKDSLAFVNEIIFKPIFKPILEFPREGSGEVHLSRYGMVYWMRKATKEIDLKVDGLNLSISNSARLIRSLYFKGEILDCSYPEYDLCDLKLPDSQFDSIVSDQVLEHLFNDPFDALKNSFRVLRPGGIAVHTTCFLHGFHPKPFDHWRFTTQGLVRLAESSGFEVLNVGSHGNRLMKRAFKSKWLWSIQVSESKFNPLRKLLIRNNPDLPIFVWLIARKPVITL